MIDKLIDMLIEEKMDYKKYLEKSEETEDMEIKEMFKSMSEDEHNHYKMIKEYLSRFIREDE